MNTEKYSFKKTKILTIIIILSTMVINGCLTLQYYPAEVVKPGKMYLGLGIHEENREGMSGNSFNNILLCDAIFFRCGLPYNFDIGLAMYSLLVFPYMLSISARKQFDLNNNLINSITVDAGGGKGEGIKEYYTSISTIRNEFAFTVGYKRTIDNRFTGSIFYNYLRNEFLLKITKRFKYRRFNIMPILYYKAVKEYNIDSYGGSFDFPSPINYIERTGWNIKQIGIGVSFYFDLL